MSGVNNPYRYQYETVAASQTAQVLGGTGAAGDYVHRLIINVITVASAGVTLIDGSTSIVISTAASAVIGPISLEVNMAAVTGPWKITTGAGATVVAVGIFHGLPIKLFPSTRSQIKGTARWRQRWLWALCLVLGKQWRQGT
jgi:hypothetical protein